MIDTAAGVVGAGVLLLGLVLATIGLYGMLRRPAIFEQLHAAGLVTGPGVILVLLASLASGSIEIASSAILVVAFVLVTASLSAHAIALAAWRSGTKAARAGGAFEPALVDEDAPETATPARGMRVLLAHDGSPGADVAVSLVASLPWGAGSMIRLIGAVEGDLQPLAPAAPSAQPADLADVSATLEAAASTLRRPDLLIDHVIRRGDPGPAIAAEAGRLGADLVVVGSRGLDPLRTLFQGSVAAAVVDAAPCPVLVARAPGVKEVLLAVDGSAPSNAAIEVVARWPIFAAVSVRVLTIATGAGPREDAPVRGAIGEVVEAAREQTVADAAAMSLRSTGRRAVAYVRGGAAAPTILAMSQAAATDLIVLGSRGRTGVRRALLGSVARDILSSARTSVLIVRGQHGEQRHQTQTGTESRSSNGGSDDW